MPRYRIQDGRQLPHHGQILEGGDVVELPRHVADDPAVRDVVTEVDEGGNAVLAPAAPHGLDRFRPHEQITLLQARLREAETRVETIKGQIARAEAEMAAESGGGGINRAVTIPAKDEE